jgi:mannose-1-phosphate guanylyltransferase/phosphomannomutase
MKAVIMAGGFGTRLRPLTNNIPKPMVPMANKPMLEHILELLQEHGITECVVLLYFQPEVIENYFGDGSEWGMKLEYITATEDYGTAGAVKLAESHINESFIVISGDVLTDFDLKAAIAFHRQKKALTTILLTRVENPLAFGVVITGEEGKIVRFLEKPTWGEVFSDTINTGIYILEPEAFAMIPSKTEFDFSKDLFPAILKEKKPLYGYIASGYWKDVGDILEYRLANLDILNKAVKVKLPGRKVEGMDKDIWLGEDAQVDFTASFSGAVVLGKNTRIGPNTRLTNTIIGDGCIIEEKANISSSVLWKDVYVGPGAVLKENVVGRRSEIKSRAFLQEGVIISDDCKIGEESTVRANVKVWPHKVVEDGATLATSLVWGEKWSKSLFGAYGVVGLANIEITPEFASKLGAAFGALLREGAVVCTSRDSHKTSRMINRALICGLLSSGVNVRDLRVTPMPVVRFQIKSEGALGATHVRKSPYDPDLMDIKVFDERGLDLPAGREKAIERLFFREDFRRAQIDGTGTLSFPTYGMEIYQRGLLDCIDKEVIRRANLKVVIDYSYGSSTTIFPMVLGELGCEIIALNAYIDQSKITKTAEEHARNLRNLSNIVRTLQADIGVMMDAGVEKLSVVDENGELLPGDLAMALVALMVMDDVPRGKMGFPITASSVLDELAQERGYQVVRTKTTYRSMMETASLDGMTLVAEPLGGFIFPAFQPAFDGMFATVKILELMAKQEVRLHQLIRRVPERIMLQEQLPCPWELKGTVMRNLIEDSANKEVEMVDGVKIKLDEGWVVLYPDHDKPFFHIIAEAKNQTLAQKILRRYSEKILSWRGAGANP